MKIRILPHVHMHERYGATAGYLACKKYVVVQERFTLGARVGGPEVARRPRTGRG
jgi:hypothetical protein